MNIFSEINMFEICNTKKCLWTKKNKNKIPNFLPLFRCFGMSITHIHKDAQRTSAHLKEKGINDNLCAVVIKIIKKFLIQKKETKMMKKFTELHKLVSLHKTRE